MPRGRPRKDKTIFDKKMEDKNIKQAYEKLLSEETKNKVEQGLKEASEGKIERITIGETLTAPIVPINDARRAKLKTVMHEINKNFDDPTMMKFAVDEPAKESISFGLKSLDDFLGGGAVYGNFVVYYGGEGVGKTTLAYMQIAEAQKAGKIACYIDLEHSVSKERMIHFGVNVDDLILIENCTTAEEAMNISIKLSKEKVVDFIVIDSVQAMSPKDEQFEGKGEKERDMEASEMALLARKMGKFLRRTAPFIYKGKVALFLIGQVRTGGLGTFITKETMTGGHAIKHWSVQTVFLRKGQGADAPVEKYTDEEGKKKDRRIGFDAVLKIEKNKKSHSKPELSELHLPFYFDQGFGE